LYANLLEFRLDVIVSVVFAETRWSVIDILDLGEAYCYVIYT
jgi:hypothetical protein